MTRLSSLAEAAIDGIAALTTGFAGLAETNWSGLWVDRLGDEWKTVA